MSKMLQVYKRISGQIINKSLNNYLKRVLCSSSDNTNDNNDKSKEVLVKNKAKKSEEALKKLNLLLQRMITEDTAESTTPKLNLAKPSSKFRNIKKEQNEEYAKNEPVEKQVLKAVKNVAESIGGNVKQTESELLSKLLNPPTNDNEEESTNKSLNLSDIISGMKIDRTVKPNANIENTSRAYQVRQLLNQTKKDYKQKDKYVFRDNLQKPKRKPQTAVNRVNLFGMEPLGIFSDTSNKPDEQIQLKTWTKLQERELRLAVTHPPENYFQEMILWTQQGKVWRFPIDNEQGLEEEKKVYFTEHVLLEKHLEPWCPTKGPVRHFMELVCVGLSKNPYITVQAKKDHIFWYRDYFDSKRKVLEEVGAIPIENIPKQQIEDK